MAAIFEAAFLCLLAFQNLAGLEQSRCCLWIDHAIAFTLVFSVVTMRP